MINNKQIFMDSLKSSSILQTSHLHKTSWCAQQIMYKLRLMGMYTGTPV